MEFDRIAGNFYNWLVDLGYMDKEDEDRGEDIELMTEDLQATYQVAPRLVNLIRDISDR